MATRGTLVVTGATSPMTILTINEYHAAFPDAHLALLVRNPAKAPSLGLPAPSDTVHYYPFDMTSLAAVRSACATLVSELSSGALPRISAALHVATIQVTAADQPHRTADGYEETMQVNHLAHFILLLELLPYMATDGRVVIVGSDSHRSDYKYFQHKAKYLPLQEMLTVEPGSEPASEATQRGWGRYGTAKMAQMMIGHELARRIKLYPQYSHLKVIMFDPGSMGGTNLMRDQPFLVRKLGGLAMRFPSVLNYLDPGLQIALKEDSAHTLYRVAVEPEYATRQPKGEVVERSGDGAPYVRPDGTEGTTYGEVNEANKCKELWEDSCKLLGYEGEKGLM